MGSEGQHAARLLTVKVGALKNKFAASAITAKVVVCKVWVRPGLNLSKTVTGKNFAALSTTDSILTLIRQG